MRNINKKILNKIVITLVCLVCAYGCTPAKKIDIRDQYKNVEPSRIFINGIELFDDEKYQAASKEFENLFVLYPFTDEAKESQLFLIESYIEQGEYESAMISADRYIKLYPSDKDTDYVVHMQGIISMERDKNFLQRAIKYDMYKQDDTNLRKALEYFNNILDKYPDSQYRSNAVEKIEQIEDILIRRGIYISRYYFDRKSYIASMNRAKATLIELHEDKHLLQSSKYEKELLQIVEDCRNNIRE